MSLIVEDGTGKSDAESYASVAELLAYWLLRGNPATVSDATTAEAETALRIATVALDLAKQKRLKGIRATGTQALEFPRLGMSDVSGYPIESTGSTSIPQRLKDATCELAKRHLDGDTLLEDRDNDGVILSTRVKVGSIEDATTYAGGMVDAKRYPIVDRLMAGFCVHGGRVVRA